MTTEMQLIQKGQFNSYQSSTNTLVSREEFSIHRSNDELHYNSVISAFNGPRQVVELVMDDKWTPTHLHSHWSSTDQLDIIFDGKEGKMVRNDGLGEKIRFFPMDKANTMILIDHALYLPFLWVNQLDFSSNGPRHLNIVPMGIATLKVGSPYVESKIRQIDLLLEIRQQKRRIVIEAEEDKQIQRIIRRNGQLITHCHYDQYLLQV